MAIYHYNQSKLIDRVEVDASRPGVIRATLIARKDADLEQCAQLRQRLGAENFSTLFDIVGDRSAIQVRGIKKVEALLSALQAEGEPVQELTAADQKQHDFRARVRGKSVFLSALFYDLGNAAFFVSGIQRGRHNPGGKFTGNDISELLIGGAFSIGDIVLTGYGSQKGDEELQAAAQGLKRHLHQKNIELPQGDALNPDTLHQSGAMKATDRWLRKHVMDIKYLSEFTGGLFTMHSALKPGNRNNGKLLAGLLICTGWMSTFLLDKPQAERMLEADGAPSGAIDKLKDNPRGLIARPLAIGNNVSNLWGSLNPKTGERVRFRQDVLTAQTAFTASPSAANKTALALAQGKQNDFIWNVISACSFMIGHALFGLAGGKRPKETDDDRCLTEDLVLMSANILAKQPAGVRDVSVDETARYFSQMAHVDKNTAQVEQAIREKIALLSQHRWADNVRGTTAPERSL